MKKVLFLILCASLVGCDNVDMRQEIANANIKPVVDLVATNTPKGSLYVMRVMADTGRSYPEPHYIYFFDNSTNTVSMNYTVRVGKSSQIRTIVIDGQEFNLIPK